MLKENNLGAFDALQLEKGFLVKHLKQETLYLIQHVNSQMAKIGEDYKKILKKVFKVSLIKIQLMKK